VRRRRRVRRGRPSSLPALVIAVLLPAGCWSGSEVPLPDGGPSGRHLEFTMIPTCPDVCQEGQQLDFIVCWWREYPACLDA
jgi:hypothetical protein